MQRILPALALIMALAGCASNETPAPKSVSPSTHPHVEGQADTHVDPVSHPHTGSEGANHND